MSFENVHCIGFTSPLNTTMSGRTCGKCRLHGKIEQLKGQKRVCPYSNCSCARCTTHDQVLAMKYTQRETKDDKGRQWRMRLDSSANLTRSKDTATAWVSSATTSFPKMLPVDQTTSVCWLSRSQILKQQNKTLKRPRRQITNEKVNY